MSVHAQGGFEWGLSVLPPGCRRLTEAEEGHCAADLQQEGKKQKEQSWSNGDRLGKMYGGAGKKRMKKTKEGVEKKKVYAATWGVGLGDGK